MDSDFSFLKNKVSSQLDTAYRIQFRDNKFCITNRSNGLLNGKRCLLSIKIHVHELAKYQFSLDLYEFINRSITEPGKLDHLRFFKFSKILHTMNCSKKILKKQKFPASILPGKITKFLFGPVKQNFYELTVFINTVEAVLISL